MTENRAASLMTIPEAAMTLRFMGVFLDESTLRAWCRDNTVPCIKAGRKVLINVNDVLGFLGID